MDDSSNANSDHLQPDSIQETYAESPSTDVEKNEEYTVGKFVIGSYDNKLFVGQITKLLLDNIEINCMVQHGKRNVFKWPNKPTAFSTTENQCHLRARAQPACCAVVL
ncbi:hypothetical protein CesoFtcFv8_016707 [Champsocephalus esox]|uniref:Uncharacterized protein n=2 Tax=Champsocephalus TaxID=52236 RepID=A0AAN8HNU7_CHAGU|nr:hypothetical protein CesoFtcFv8_016707 [Champsocephalus esox]KAK5918639.1 hypothetical protein CgunFtcFv8_003384 [Champsocephalus gunnari]